METNEDEQPQFVRIGEAAAIAEVSIATLRRWERDGWIASVRTPGGQRRFRRADVLELIGFRADA